MKLYVVIQQAVVLSTLFLSAITITVIAPKNSITTSLASVSLQAAQNREEIIYHDALLLNNKPVNYADFSLLTKGILTVVTANPETTDVEKIPFRIYLRRDGENIISGVSDTTRSLLTVDVASILSIAKAGDYLIIDPTRESDSEARRSIKVRDFYFNSILFSFLKNKNDGC
ncbi:hypothetical protein [Spirosoma flavum]|uniref:Uncharacterized protein n=1 Tax=Spirosoma flavum TaxID=2048557 RepID=A0ABW6ANA9_9BACT